ncbi:hypothetical protein LCGC14_1671550 [marine sediment metagenome]|uniref:Methyltransferase FkbM domain-containing protein n=1 Tax=marine sediment metagenome TaxID=412755 RepID=A0A0F9K6Z3_9ZZZZ
MSPQYTLHYEGSSYAIAAPHGDHISKWFEVASFYELDLLNAVRDLRLRGDQYLDIGAHVGNHSIFFRRVLGGRVYAFEPNFSTFQSLRLNAEDHGFVAYNVAIHDKYSAVTVREKDPANIGMSHVVEGGEVMARTIDSFDFDDVALLKIDTEGCEGAVLRSARKTIKKWRPAIIAEAHDDEDRRKIEHELEPLGYKVRGCYAMTPTYIWTVQQ